MIIVTHEINFARHVSDRVIYLNQGKIEEEGPAEEVIDRPKSRRLAHVLSGDRWGEWRVGVWACRGMGLFGHEMARQNSPGLQPWVWSAQDPPACPP